MTTAANTNTTSTASSVPVGPAACDTFNDSGSMYGHCATPQPITTAATAPIEKSRAQRRRVAQQHPERHETADRGDDHERQRTRREAVVEVGRVGVEHEDPDERDDTGDDRRDDRAAAEVLTQVGIAEPVRVPHQIDGREVRAHGDREQAADDRRGVDPARPRDRRPCRPTGRAPTRSRPRPRPCRTERAPMTRRTRRRSCGDHACA